MADRENIRIRVRGSKPRNPVARELLTSGKYRQRQERPAPKRESRYPAAEVEQALIEAQDDDDVYGLW